MTKKTEMAQSDEPPNLISANEQTLSQLAADMRVVGLFMVIYAILNALGGLAALAAGDWTSAASFVDGVLFSIAGIWTRQAGAAFAHAASEPDQLGLKLTAALEKLSRLFVLFKWSFVVLAVAFVLVALASFFLYFVYPRLV